MTENELIDKLWETAHAHDRICLPTSIIKEMLSVVKSHIGSVAKPCDCKVNYYQKCPSCNGYGVIARGDK